jgi:hypothetical protein
MERQDESLTTRDLAGTGREAPVEPVDEAPAHDAPPAEQDDRADRDAMAGEQEAGRGAVAAAQEPTADPAQEPTADPAQGTGAAQDVDESGSLLPGGEESDFQRRWEEIQTRFVDDPRQAVEDADALVAGVMQRIADGFAQARDGLEGQWSRGEDVGTEELRVALQRYRAFFRRLLSA